MRKEAVNRLPEQTKNGQDVVLTMGSTSDRPHGGEEPHDVRASSEGSHGDLPIELTVPEVRRLMSATLDEDEEHPEVSPRLVAVATAPSGASQTS